MTRRNLNKPHLLIIHFSGGWKWFVSDPEGEGIAETLSEAFEAAWALRDGAILKGV